MKPQGNHRQTDTPDNMGLARALWTGGRVEDGVSPESPYGVGPDYLEGAFWLPHTLQPSQTRGGNPSCHPGDAGQASLLAPCNSVWRKGPPP